MTGLTAAVQRIGMSVGQLQNAQQIQLRIDQLKDKVESFINDVAPLIDRVSQVARELNLDATRFQAEAIPVLKMLEEVRETLGNVGAMELDLGLLTKAGKKVKQFGDELHSASLESWAQFKAERLSLGSVSLLEAAQAAGLEVPGNLQISLDHVRAVNNPTVDHITKAWKALAEYEDLRQQLTQGDPKIEELLIGLTSQGGIPLYQLNGSPDLQHWLSQHNLDESLVVVLGKGTDDR